MNTAETINNTMSKGHRKRFPKLVKLLVLYIKINFSQRYINIFLEIKLVVLKLALLASHMAETLIENLIVFIEHIKWCTASHTIVQRNIHEISMIIPDV